MQREDVERLAHHAAILAAPLMKGGEFEALRAHHEDTAIALCALLDRAEKAEAEVARLAAPETLAWAVVGEDGHMNVSLIRQHEVPPSALHEGERVVRVAIRVVEDGTD